MVTGRPGSEESVAQHFQLVETSGDSLCVELADVDPGVPHSEVLDEEDVDLAPGLVYHGDPLVTGHPGCVGC